MEGSEDFSIEMKKDLLIPGISNHYSYYDAINVISQLEDEFPEFLAVTSFGETYEGRDIPLLTLSMGDHNPKSKPAILITGAHHSREALSI